MTVVAVERPFGRLFRLLSFPLGRRHAHFYGTESFAVEPNYDTGSWLAEEFSGRVLYDSPDGTTYTAPYIDPGTEQASLSNWYENCFRQLYCADALFPQQRHEPARLYRLLPSSHYSDDVSPPSTDYSIMSTRAAASSTPCRPRAIIRTSTSTGPAASYAPFERVQDYFVLLPERRRRLAYSRHFSNNSVVHGGMPQLCGAQSKGAILFHKREWPL